MNSYKGHLCKGFNIESSFLANEKYIVTGSEDSHIYIYDSISSNLVSKIKTNQKCVNLVKPLPDSNPYSFVYTGLEDISIYVHSTNKFLSKNIEKAYAKKNNQTVENDGVNEYIFEEKDKETNKQMKLIEEIMSECGDMILRIFHANNLTYSNGMNFEHLMEIIQRNNDEESLRIMQIV